MNSIWFIRSNSSESWNIVQRSWLGVSEKGFWSIGFSKIDFPSFALASEIVQKLWKPLLGVQTAGTRTPSCYSYRLFFKTIKNVKILQMLWRNLEIFGNLMPRFREQCTWRSVTAFWKILWPVWYKEKCTKFWMKLLRNPPIVMFDRMNSHLMKLCIKLVIYKLVTNEKMDASLQRF